MKSRLIVSFAVLAKVSDVLWNVHSYYKQFVSRVEQSLSEAREPIEKELKVCKCVVYGPYFRKRKRQECPFFETPIGVNHHFVFILVDLTSLVSKNRN